MFGHNSKKEEKGLVTFRKKKKKIEFNFNRKIRSNDEEKNVLKKKVIVITAQRLEVEKRKREKKNKHYYSETFVLLSPIEQFFFSFRYETVIQQRFKMMIAIAIPLHKKHNKIS